MAAIKCCLCSKNLTAVHDFNNPDPLDGRDADKMCCNDCDECLVIPARGYLWFYKHGSITRKEWERSYGYRTTGWLPKFEQLMRDHGFINAHLWE